MSTTIRIDAYEETSRPIAGDLAQLELLRARFNADDYWPQHWYLMGWLTAPLLDIHPIDPFYLYYRCNDLPEVADREECLCQAMQYAVLYSEHCFITQLNKDYPFDSSWLVSTYHRAMIEALRAAYSRDGDGLHSQIEGLKRAAGNPRQWREVEIMERRYSHYMA